MEPKTTNSGNSTERNRGPRNLPGTAQQREPKVILAHRDHPLALFNLGLASSQQTPSLSHPTILAGEGPHRDPPQVGSGAGWGMATNEETQWRYHESSLQVTNNARIITGLPMIPM